MTAYTEAVAAANRAALWLDGVRDGTADRVQIDATLAVAHAALAVADALAPVVEVVATPRNSDAVAVEWERPRVENVDGQDVRIGGGDATLANAISDVVTDVRVLTDELHRRPGGNRDIISGMRLVSGRLARLAERVRTGVSPSP